MTSRQSSSSTTSRHSSMRSPQSDFVAFDESDSALSPEEASARKQALLDSMLKRQEAATTSVSSASVARKTVDVFESKFNIDVSRLREKLITARPEDVASLLQSDLHPLQQLLSEHSSILPPFLLRRSQGQLTALHEQLHHIAAQRTTAQKRGFKFKAGSTKASATSSANSSATSPGDADTVDAAASGDHAPGGSTDRKALIDSRIHTVVGHKDEVVVVDESKVKNGLDVVLLNIFECRVYIRVVTATFRCRNVRNSTIICAPCVTTVFLEHCKGTTLVCAGQQLRAHRSTDCTIYLHSRTEPIIEYCSNMRFAPYAVTENQDEAFKLAQVPQDVNKWDNVKDFQWLVSAKPSPNWSILPEGERQAFSINETPPEFPKKAEKAVRGPIDIEAVMREQSSLGYAETGIVPEEYVVHGRQDETVIVDESCTKNDYDVYLRNIFNCRVYIRVRARTIHCHNVQDSTVICAPNKGPFMLEHAHQSTIVCACREMRLFRCLDTSIYLLCRIGPILEHCRRLRFAPYTVSEAEVDRETLLAAALTRQMRQWQYVKDFQCVGVKKPPANHSIIPETERMIFSVRNTLTAVEEKEINDKIMKERAKEAERKVVEEAERKAVEEAERKAKEVAQKEAEVAKEEETNANCPSEAAPEVTKTVSAPKSGDGVQQLAQKA